MKEPKTTTQGKLELYSIDNLKTQSFYVGVNAARLGRTITECQKYISSICYTQSETDKFWEGYYFE